MTMTMKEAEALIKRTSLKKCRTKQERKDFGMAKRLLALNGRLGTVGGTGRFHPRAGMPPPPSKKVKKNPK